MPRTASSISPEYLAKHGIEVPKQQRGNKYGAKKREYNGHVYDSELEASVAMNLDLLMHSGNVTCWRRQVVYDLAAGIQYRADFLVEYANGKPRVIDAKGLVLAEFKLKAKLFADRYGFEIDVVKKASAVPTEGR